MNMERLGGFSEHHKREMRAIHRREEEARWKKQALSNWWWDVIFWSLVTCFGFTSGAVLGTCLVNILRAP